MFDVSWSDPTRETVGQRKNRKEHDQHSVTSGIQRRPSSSSDSVTAKHRPSLLTLLNGNRKDFSRPASRANLAVPGKELARELPRSRAGGVVEVVSSVHELPAGTLTSDKLLDRYVITELPALRDRDTYSQSDEPAFASWASRSASTDSTWSSMTDSPRKSNFVQPLSPTSFITQRTEITVASREDAEDDEAPVTVVHISAAGKVPAITQDLPPQLSPSSSTSDFQVPELYPVEKSAYPIVPQDAVLQPSEKPSANNVTETNRWQPPGNWECPPTPLPPPKSSARPPWRPNGDTSSFSASDVAQALKNLRRMRTASPKIMLERLTEEWTDHGDATIDEELEFEKQLWMRTALHACAQMCIKEEDWEIRRSALSGDSTSAKAVKILSLYEDHASLAFLSTLNPAPASELHHLSTAAFPSENVYSLTVPSPKPHLSYAPALFSTIHASLALPALLPSSSIPTVLKECHRVLRRGGSLHLTLVDPCPVAATMGPRLREWLDTHLLLELERKFRCTNPCRLVPGWLADAGFSGPSASCTSMVTQIRFAAATETALGGSYRHDNSKGADAKLAEELKAVVGRRLWEECWGRFCVDVEGAAEGAGARRWWDDRQVVGECVAMGTTWEALVIEAGTEA